VQREAASVIKISELMHIKEISPDPSGQPLRGQCGHALRRNGLQPIPDASLSNVHSSIVSTKPQAVCLSSTAVALPQHPDENRSQYPVLLAVDEQLGKGPRRLPPTFSTYWARFAKAHGLDAITFHTLRHGTATLLLAADVPDAVVISIMGQADTGILRRYQEVIPDLMRDATARLEALLAD
jgi:integrase